MVYRNSDFAILFTGISIGAIGFLLHYMGLQAAAMDLLRISLCCVCLQLLRMVAKRKSKYKVSRATCKDTGRKVYTINGEVDSQTTVSIDEKGIIKATWNKSYPNLILWFLSGDYARELYSQKPVEVQETDKERVETFIV